MQPQSRSKRISISIITIVFIGVLLVSLLLYRTLSFHLVKIAPDINNVSVISPSISFEFNEPLNKNIRVNASSGLVNKYMVIDKVVDVSLYIPLSANQKYYVTIENIKSTTGKSTSNKTFYFVPKKVQNGRVTLAQNKALLNKQQQYSEAINGNQLLALLPFTGPNFEYQIDYTVIYSSKDNPIPVIDITAPNSQGKTDALNWIKNQGFNPSNYAVQYKTGQP